MYILDTKKQSKLYLFISIFCIVFAFIYEHFSHGIYSNYMIYAFLIPLIFGFVPSIILTITKKNINRLSMNVYNASVANITLYMLFSGVLEIYGTTNQLINVYLYMTIILVVIGIYGTIKYDKKTNNW